MSDCLTSAFGRLASQLTPPREPLDDGSLLPPAHGPLADRHLTDSRGKYAPREKRSG